MTSIRTEEAEETTAARAQTFIDWTRINARFLTIGALVIVAAGGGYWIYLRSRQIEAGNAEKALMSAKQSIGAGNLSLAQSDLQKVYARYGSTAAGVQAAVLLAQVNYDGGKFQDGISLLEKVSGSSAASGIEPTVRSLIGDGYMQMRKAAEGAKEYERAAEASPHETEKAFQMAKAARAYEAAGNAAKAREIWTSLLNDPKNQAMSAEARVRLGELSAQAANR
jgi:predicted negative regulator of RcsB-dependent stress response